MKPQPQHKQNATLDAFIPKACAAPVVYFQSNAKVVCSGKGEAKNVITFSFSNSIVQLATDGEVFRFPPDQNELVCDWCLFTATQPLVGWFVELKSGKKEFRHALDQLTSTMTYMCRHYQMTPTRAYVVMRGASPSLTAPGQAQLYARFKKKWPTVNLILKKCGAVISNETLC